MKYKKLIPALLIIVLIFSHNVQSQSFYKKRNSQHLILQGGTGTAHYFGDLVDDFYFTINGQITAGAQYIINERVIIGADFTFFRLNAEDKNSEVKALRNLSFFSNNYELAAIARFPLFRLPVRFYNRSLLNPYLFGGVGFLYYNNKTEYNGDKYSLRPLKTEGVEYKPYTLTIPFGIGLNYKLNAFIDLTAEAGFRYTLTDYLDDVSSGIYPDPASFQDDIARSLSDRSGEAGANPTFAEEQRNVRGNPNANDAYFLFQFKVAYYLSPLNQSFKTMKYRGTKRRKRRR